MPNESFEQAIEKLKTKPYYQDKYTAIILGDNKKILWELPFHFAHAVITDPPYLIEGNKEMNWDGGRDYIKDIDKNEFADSFDFNLINKLEDNLININMALFCSKSQLYDYFKLMKSMKIKNFQLLSWHKPDAIPIGCFYLLDTEFIFHLWNSLKTEKKPINTYYIHNIMHTKYNHPTVKPEKIVTSLIQRLTNPDEIIIDPFLGSGTTAVCAKRLGRKCIGIEIKEKYAQIAAERLMGTESNQIQWGMFNE